MKSELTRFNELNPHLAAMIKQSVEDACVFLNNMSVDDSETMTIKNVKIQSRYMLQTMLDPDYSSTVLSNTIQEAMDEYIDAKVGLAIVY